MHSVLSWQRTHTHKNHILAMYHPESNMACVEKVKTQHFLTIGRSRGGKEWLLPEEALFLIERGSMDCRWPVKREEGDGTDNKIEDGVPMSLQAAYSAFIGFEEGVGGKLTLEMYSVYAGLKRAGYIVFRTGTWDDNRGELQPLSALAQKENQATPGIISRFFTEIWRRLSQPTHTVGPKDLAFGPLIKPGLYRSYADIYRLLKVVPTHDYTAPPTFHLPSDPSNPFRIHFDLFKTSGKFRKSNRPPPDYRVCVINARETSVPTGAQLNDLMAQLPDDPPKENAQIYPKLKHGKRNVILAVVDNGVPSYIRVADANFSQEKLYERSGRAPRGKGGRGRGGRGRGRGRAR